MRKKRGIDFTRRDIIQYRYFLSIQGGLIEGDEYQSKRHFFPYPSSFTHSFLWGKSEGTLADSKEAFQHTMSAKRRILMMEFRLFLFSLLKISAFCQKSHR